MAACTPLGTSHAAVPRATRFRRSRRSAGSGGCMHLRSRSRATSAGRRSRSNRSLEQPPVARFGLSVCCFIWLVDQARGVLRERVSERPAKRRRRSPLVQVIVYDLLSPRRRDARAVRGELPCVDVPWRETDTRPIQVTHAAGPARAELIEISLVSARLAGAAFDASIRPPARAREARVVVAEHDPCDVVPP